MSGKRYTAEFKIEAVQQVADSGYSVTGGCRVAESGERGAANKSGRVNGD